MRKDEARNLGLKRRAAISEAQRAAYDQNLFEQMKRCAGGASLVGCYVSVRQEADTRAFLAWCLDTGVPVSVPKTEGRTLAFYRLRSLDDLKPGAYGIPEPCDGEPVSLDDIDVMFVPLSAFDSEHGRTGYGKGYYDSILRDSMRKIGLAYPEQEVDRIETDPWDIRLDKILTPMEPQRKKGV